MKRYPAPLELGPDVSTAPTDYVQGLLQGVAPERQAARLQTELDGLTQESLRLRKKINELLATDVRPEDPRVQVLLRRIRGTDAEYGQRNGVPVPHSLNDRADQIRVALAPPRPGELRHQTLAEDRKANLRAPAPNSFQKSVGKLQPVIEHMAGMTFPLMEAGRRADLASAKEVEQEADAAAKLPRPGTAAFGRMEPAAAVMERFFPTGTLYGAAQVDRIVASPGFRQARAGVTPQTRQYLDRLVARLRVRDGRSTDANTGTAETAGLVADIATARLFKLINELTTGL